MGGATSALIACPSELIKCILQNHHTIESPKQAVGYILRDRGLTGFYKGMVFTLVRDIPAYAAFFGSYSVIKESVHENSRKYF